MILETIEPYLEVINLIMAIVIILVGIKVWTRVEGSLKKTWNYFSVAIMLFGVHEVFGSLEEWNLFEIGGLYAFTEFIFIIALLIAVFSFRGLLESLSKLKSGSKK